MGVALVDPDWIVDRLFTDLGVADGRAALGVRTSRRASTLRPNPRRAERGGADGRARRGRRRRRAGALVPDALVVRGGGDPARCPPSPRARATPQDQASQAVVARAGPAPGDRVLDVAAAPGGKATALAERWATAGSVVAVDVHAGPPALVGAAARRLGLRLGRTRSSADGRRPPVAPGPFDRVLLDAPCSGLGVLRRRPEARWRVPEPTEG